jgi:hypothetical protein
MKAAELNKSDKLYLTVDDIARTLSITRESAKVTAARYFNKGYLIRLKKDFYTTPDKFNNLKEPGLFKLANIIQTPSYISLLTALGYYNISTQQQRNLIESIALKRTKSISIQNLHFTYSLIKKEMYEGFELRDDFFIALPEKALSDVIYLFSLGRYSCDLDAIDFKKLNKKKIQKFLEKTNKKTILYWEKICASYKI